MPTVRSADSRYCSGWNEDVSRFSRSFLRIFKRSTNTYSGKGRAEFTKSKTSRKIENEKRINEMLEENARLDEYYDGYYDDILPDDEDEPAKTVDRETAEKIMLIAAVLGAVMAVCIFIILKV